MSAAERVKIAYVSPRYDKLNTGRMGLATWRGGEFTPADHFVCAYLMFLTLCEIAKCRKRLTKPDLPPHPQACGPQHGTHIGQRSFEIIVHDYVVELTGMGHFGVRRRHPFGHYVGRIATPVQSRF